MTLIFGTVQAMACAEAGLSVISPFIGRVKDWFAAHPERSKEPLTDDADRHPGVLLVRDIRQLFAQYGLDKTEIMAAGFRRVDEVVALAKVGGPDVFTLQPELLQALLVHGGFAVRRPEHTRVLEGRQSYLDVGGEAQFSQDLAEEAIAVDKVPEGLEKFSADVVRMEQVMGVKMVAFEEGRLETAPRL
jgi:transaldolase